MEGLTDLAGDYASQADWISSHKNGVLKGSLVPSLTDFSEAGLTMQSHHDIIHHVVI